MKKEAIKRACAAYNFEWPKNLWTGVMFFDGYKITIEEFNTWASNFN